MDDFEIHWKIDSSESCFYAVECLLLQDRDVDTELAAALAEPLARLEEFTAVSPLPSATFLEHLVPQAGEIGNNRQLASVVLTKTFGPQKTEALISRFAELLTEFENRFDRVVPSAALQLAADSARLREQWLGQGNVMLAGIARLTEPEVIVSSAKVSLVYPACGGGGRAHLLYNSVSLEAVASDQVAELPELVRLIWLISQLNADLPMYQGEIHRDRLFDVASLAMIPVTLAAATELDLVQLNEATLQQAVATWREELSDPTETADALWRWWDAFLNRESRWPIALAALDQLLGE